MNTYSLKVVTQATHEGKTFDVCELVGAPVPMFTHVTEDGPPVEDGDILFFPSVEEAIADYVACFSDQVSEVPVMKH
jgi:hypothetical protein